MKDCAALLAAQSRYDLADLCMRMGLEPAGAKETKADTAARLTAAMEAHPETVRESFGLYCLDALAEAVRHRTGELTLMLSKADKAPELTDALDLLRHFGLAWRDRRLWHLLPQVRSLVAMDMTERRMLEAGMDLLRQITLAVNRFGIVPIDVILASGKEDDPERQLVRLSMLTLYSRFYGLSGFCPGPDGKLWLRAPDCEDPARVMTGQLACELRGIAWPTDPLAEVIAFADADVPLNDKSAALLRDVFGKLAEPDADWLAECLEDAFLLLQDGDREGALEALCDIFTDREYDDAHRWLMDRLLNMLPVWTLRGHAIGELSGKLKQKTPDNPDEPCPCGSGRTWGRCHGRLN